MEKKMLIKCLLVGVMGSVGAFADMTVDKSNGVLTVTSDTTGTVIAKVIGPNDEMVVNEKYEGNSFSWTPSGVDGAYRYDVRVVPASLKVTADNANGSNSIQTDGSDTKPNYAGGVIEIVNDEIQTSNSKKSGGIL